MPYLKAFNVLTHENLKNAVHDDKIGTKII